jgi:hypothetical protein
LPDGGLVQPVGRLAEDLPLEKKDGTTAIMCKKKRDGRLSGAEHRGQLTGPDRLALPVELIGSVFSFWMGT